METSLKVYYCGYGGNSFMAEELRPIINELKMVLITIHEHDNAGIKWDKDTWLGHLKEADIIISPANYKIQPAKSANRLTQGMSLGKPMICSPLPAYLDVGKKHPGCFLIADSKDEWRERLKLLRDTPAFRKQLGERALKASQDYSLDAIGKKWDKLLQEDFSKVIIQDKETSVDIIIPTYKNVDYLKLCLESIYKNTETPFKIIISDAGSDEDTWKYLNTRKEIIIGEISQRKNYSEACNAGIKKSTSKYFVIINSDTIVSKGWLRNMVDKMESVPRLAACGVLSNCDRGWLF